MLETLFSDPGAQIKKYAKICFIVELVACIIIGIAMIALGSFLAGLLVAVIGACGAYLGSLMIYAFGELVESTKYAKVSSEKLPVAPAPVIPDELPEL